MVMASLLVSCVYPVRMAVFWDDPGDDCGESGRAHRALSQKKTCARAGLLPADTNAAGGTA